MPTEQEQLQAGIAALEAQRSLLGDAVVDASVAGLRAKLAALTTSTVAPAEPTQTLKHVSILFLDVVGSTALAQQLDPEDVSAVMDGLLARGTAVVQAHGGRVLQYAGDNILAAFGADGAREDDAERAVRSGLALLELGQTLGAEVHAAHGRAGCTVRIGIHTGGVLLGGGVDEDGSIRGSAVNIAARMEQSAPSGALRISHDTYRHVRGVFDVLVQEPLAVKGVEAPVRSYLVQRAKPRSFRIAARGIEGVATRMIGRDAELEALQDAFKHLVGPAATLAVVTVVAEAGIGKSRLLYEFEKWSEARPEVFFLFRGRATPQTQGQPFGLLRDLLAWRFQINDDDTLEAARAKIEQGIIPLFAHDDGPDLAEGHAHLLGHLIGIEWRDSRHIRGILDDPRQIRNRALHAAAQMFRRLAARDANPVILQLEDLHWADNETLDFLVYLAEVNRDVPMLMLGLARPTLYERRSDWKSSEGRHLRVDLAPLDKTGCRQLVNELLKRLPEVPAALRELVTTGSEGNPFYMEELVKMLIDQGAISVGDEHWTLDAGKLLTIEVPPTLTGVLQARLDGLPAPERQALQEASVIGPVFWDQALFALDDGATQALPALVERELALPRADAALDGLREFAFRHQVLHQVTYGTVLKRTRRELHGKLAHWLANHKGLRANDFLGIAAEHFEQAGEAGHAALYHTQAAEHAATRFAHEAVLGHVARALQLLRDLPDSAEHQDLRWRLLKAREQALDLQGQREAQRADIDAMEALAQTIKDDRKGAYAAWRCSDISMRTGNFAGQETAARRAMALAERAGDDERRLIAQRMLAAAHVEQGDLAAGQALVLATLQEAQARGLQQVQSYCLNTLTLIASARQDRMGCFEMISQQMALSSEIGNQRGEAVGLNNLAQIWLDFGEFATARRDLEACLRLSRTSGDRLLECVALYGLSKLSHMQGDDVHALAQARQAVDMAATLQYRVGQALAGLRLGDAELALGRHEQARQAYEQARVVAQQVGSPHQHEAAAALARVASAQGDAAAALQHVEQVLAHLATGGTLSGTDRPHLIDLICHQVFARAGDPRAAEWLQRAYRNLQEKAGSIGEAAMRQKFLTQIPEHREIVAAWRASEGGSDGSDGSDRSDGEMALASGR